MATPCYSSTSRHAWLRSRFSGRDGGNRASQLPATGSRRLGFSARLTRGVGFPRATWARGSRGTTGTARRIRFAIPMRDVAVVLGAAVDDVMGRTGGLETGAVMGRTGGMETSAVRGDEPPAKLHGITQRPKPIHASTPAMITDRPLRREPGGTGVAYLRQPSDPDRCRSRIGRPYGGRPTRRGSAEGF